VTNEEIISDFIQKHYTDERLAWLLAHAESGQLAFVSCCCLIGIATADHALRGLGESTGIPHYETATLLKGADAAEGAYCELGIDWFDTEADAEAQDALRRKRLIPLVQAEMSRREALRNLKQELSDLGEALKVSV
jgi:hypothetical protein